MYIEFSNIYVHDFGYIDTAKFDSSDRTGTVSGTVPARNNVGLVRSGLGTFFVPEPEHAKHFFCS